MKKKLKRTRQCDKCPWKKSTNPHEIPSYDAELHKSLEDTISQDPYDFIMGGAQRGMNCHEHGTGVYCVGWLANQLGPGNNIGLRLYMRGFDLSQLRTDGEQHETFRDTLPPGAKD